MSTSSDPAERLLRKLRTFIEEELDSEEAGLLAALVAPGIANAHTAADGFDNEGDDEDEVVGFDQGSGAGVAEWRPGALPESLANAIRGRNLRIEGL